MQYNEPSKAVNEILIQQARSLKRALRSLPPVGLPDSEKANPILLEGELSSTLGGEILSFALIGYLGPSGFTQLVTTEYSYSIQHGPVTISSASEAGISRLKLMVERIVSQDVSPVPGLAPTSILDITVNANHYEVQMSRYLGWEGFESRLSDGRAMAALGFPSVARHWHDLDSFETAVDNGISFLMGHGYDNLIPRDPERDRGGDSE